MLDYKCRMCGEKLEKQKILNRRVNCSYCGTGHDIKRGADGEDIIVESESGASKLGYHASWTVDNRVHDFEQKMIFRMYYLPVIIIAAILALVVIGLGTYLLTYSYIALQEISIGAIIVLIGGVYLTVAVPIYIKYASSKSWKMRNGLKINIVFKYDDFRINAKTADGNVICGTEKYSAVFKAFASSEYIFFKFSIAKGMAIPLRAFGDKKKEAIDFLKEILGEKYVTVNIKKSDPKPKKTNSKPPKSKPPTRGGNYNRKGKR